MSKYRFTWRSGNRFEVLTDGPVFFPAMLAAIAGARQYVAMEMYLVESGRVLNEFIDALLAAATRGVRVYLLFDDFGARGVTEEDRLRLRHSNIQLHFYNPLHYGQLRRSLFRDHRKLLLVDDAVAFTGGAGITDQFLPQPGGHRHWHDRVIRIEGPCVADWRTLFDGNWSQRHPPVDQAINPPHLLESGKLGRVTISQMGTHQEVQRSFLKRLRSAEHWIVLATAYFMPSWKVRSALKRAAKRGVDVRLMLPGSHTDHPAVRHAGRRFYYRLLRHGVRIFEYQPRFSHVKLYLCDQWCSIGSSNMDRWNHLWNLEANQEIDDQAFAESIRELVDEDLKQCREITLQHWLKRPWHRRLMEWFWGRTDVALHRWILRWRYRRRHQRVDKAK